MLDLEGCFGEFADHQGWFGTPGASHHQVHLFVNDVACTLLVPRCSGRKSVGLFFPVFFFGLDVLGQNAFSDHNERNKRRMTCMYIEREMHIFTSVFVFVFVYVCVCVCVCVCMHVCM